MPEEPNGFSSTDNAAFRRLRERNDLLLAQHVATLVGIHTRLAEAAKRINSIYREVGREGGPENIR